MSNLTPEERSKYLTFQGVHPLTGLPNYFIFGENNPGKTRVLKKDKDFDYWYSENAGISWQRIAFAIAMYLIDDGLVDVLI